MIQEDEGGPRGSESFGYVRGSDSQEESGTGASGDGWLEDMIGSCAPV